ncbi:protein PERCC1, partial [Xenopus laevis]|uniref:Protein PERCC1 n=1 Tax=Xenopus laevis TaxID=8355 RepID=A0A8J0U4K9_XENLA
SCFGAMATGVIRNVSEFKFPPPFHIPFLYPSLQDDMDFQESSEDEEEEELLEDEDMEDEVEGLNPATPVPSDNMNSQYTSDLNTEMTLQLLKFSELISSDIQRYFGPKTKEEDPDSCNIYEDYSGPQLSGQEVYYRDLVKMAHDREDLFNPLTPPGDIDQKILQSICTKEDPKKLGPLMELFDFGLQKYTRQKVTGSKEGRQQRLDKKYAHIVPMTRRMLPMSFWKEPTPAPVCMLNTNTPDFSDLLENWTSDAHSELHSTTRDLISEFSR